MSFAEFKSPGPKRYRLLKVNPELLAIVAGDVGPVHCPDWPKGARVVCSFWEEAPLEAVVLVIEHETFEEIPTLDKIPTWNPLWIKGERP